MTAWSVVEPENATFNFVLKGRQKMRLYPIQKELTLYEEGFGDTDLLQRIPAGKRISELIEEVQDPLVLAIDGAWGSGKSYFLRRWVGAHKLENGGKATTVYFDAFANDFLDDPLIGLTGAIGERLPQGQHQNSWKKAKKVVLKVTRPALRVAAAVLTAGATEVAGPILDAAIEAGGREAEAAAEAFWRREDGRRVAMLQFRDALAEITKDGVPLVIIVDELDRCRPDYALAVLEVVKHFFSVERVHFILGVNLEALEHIVRVRYGSSINAGDYLKRFISVSYHLPQHVGRDVSAHASIQYLRSAASGMGIDAEIVGTIEEQIRLASRSTPISLRDIEKVLTRVVLLPRRKEFNRFLPGYRIAIISLLIWQVVRPDFVRGAFRRTLSITEIENFFGITEPLLKARTETYDHPAYFLRGVWQMALTGTVDNKDDAASFARTFDNFGRVGNILETIERDFFSGFEVSTSQ